MPSIRAVIVAAGRGARFGGATPKQFELLAGRAVFTHAVQRLAQVPDMEEIMLVMPLEGFPHGMAGTALNIPVRVVCGGIRRQDSVAAGLAAFSGPCDVALVHDGARPFPPLASMDNLISASIQHGGGLLAVRATDTVKQDDSRGRVESTLDRARLWLAQTPQAIRGDHVARVIELLKGDEIWTDEAAVMESMQIPVALVEGSAMNFKITHPGDLKKAEALLAAGLT